MSELAEQGFLKAIVAALDEDFPRLVYADWLEESNDPEQLARAALIRVQCQRYRWPEGDPQFYHLLEEERRLLARYQTCWTAGLQALVQDIEFQRGFPSRGSMPISTFIQHGQNLCAQTTLRQLKLTGSLTELYQLRRASALGCLSSLDLSACSVMPQMLPRLFGSADLRGIAELRLVLGHEPSTSMQSVPAFGRLLPIDGLTSLRHLDLSGSAVSPDLMRSLRHSGWITQLDSLTLAHAQLRNGALQLLPGSHSLNNLRHFNVASNWLSESELLFFLQSNSDQAWESLDVSWNLNEERIGDRTAMWIAHSPSSMNLRRLNLAGCRLSAVGMQELACSPHLQQLYALNLSGNQLDRQGGRAFFSAAQLPQLTLLDLSFNQIRDTGLQALQTAIQLDRLRYLNLDRTEFGGPGIRALVEAVHLASVTRLSLSQNFIGDDAAEILASSSFPELKILELKNNHLSFQGIRTLLTSRPLEGVQRFCLAGNPLTRVEQQKLIAAFGERIDFVH